MMKLPCNHPWWKTLPGLHSVIRGYVYPPASLGQFLEWGGQEFKRAVFTYGRTICKWTLCSRKQSSSFLRKKEVIIGLYICFLFDTDHRICLWLSLARTGSLWWNGGGIKWKCYKMHGKSVPNDPGALKSRVSTQESTATSPAPIPGKGHCCASHSSWPCHQIFIICLKNSWEGPWLLPVAVEKVSLWKTYSFVWRSE